MTDDAKRPAMLLWSGGADSTLLLYALLRMKERVRTLTVVHDQLGQNHQQAVARFAVTVRLRALGLSWGHREVRVSSDACVTPGGLPQPALWLTIASAYLDPGEDLVLGWHRGDDALARREAMARTLDAVTDLVHSEEPGKTNRLLTPLESLWKAQVVDALHALDLLDLTWTCEVPEADTTMRACGDCVPCATLRMARAQRKILPTWSHWIDVDGTLAWIWGALRQQRGLPLEPLSLKDQVLVGPREGEGTEGVDGNGVGRAGAVEAIMKATEKAPRGESDGS